MVNTASILFGPGGSSSSATYDSSTNGAGTTVARLKVSISLLFLLAVAALVLLHRVGFRFSVTVG